MQLTEKQVERLYAELSHEYDVHYTEPATGLLNVCTFTSGRKPTDIVVKNIPTNLPPATERQVFTTFLSAVADDPDDCHLVLDVSGVKHKTLAGRASLYRLQELTDGWQIEDDIEAKRESDNAKQRGMMQQLRACEKYVPAMLRGGNGLVVQKFRRVIATAWGPDGTLQLDVAAAQEVLGAFVGLTMQDGYSL